MTMEMFSRRQNEEWRRQGGANTPLALQYGVDFEVVSSISVLDERYLSLYRSGKISTQQLQDLERTQNNIVVQIEMVLKVVK
jgi:hypothetical protein